MATDAIEERTGNFKQDVNVSPLTAGVSILPVVLEV
jgi:hypothetical protein